MFCTYVAVMCNKKAIKYIDRFKQLNLFFNSPKQNERLEEAQAELAKRFRNQCELQDQLSDQSENLEESQLHILRTITEVPTRWGSALASWRRLRELKPAIKRVLVNLSVESDFSSKKDYRQLQERMLKAYEWNLLDKLIELFKPRSNGIFRRSKVLHIVINLSYNSSLKVLLY